jgi:hypothetical protein
LALDSGALIPSVLASLQQNQDHSTQILTGFQLIQQPKQSRLLMAKTQLTLEAIQKTVIRPTGHTSVNRPLLSALTKERRQLWFRQKA